MPIIRIPYPNALPTVQQDYVDQNNLLSTGFMRVNDPWPVSAGNIVQGAVFQVGGTVYYCNAATAIGGAASDYVKLTPAGGGATLTPSFVANLAGVSWNSAYNGYYDAPGNLYVFDEARALLAGQLAAVKTKYITQNADGSVDIANKLRLNGDLRLDGDGVDQNKTIRFASDAALRWIEASNRFEVDKELHSTKFLSTGLGRRLTKSWAINGNRTQDQWYTELSAYLPSINDAILLHGAYNSVAFSETITRACGRINATTIQILGCRLVACIPTSENIVQGSATIFSNNNGIAW